eukprot:g3056.t1
MKGRHSRESRGDLHTTHVGRDSEVGPLEAEGSEPAEPAEPGGFAIGDEVFGMIRGLPQRDRGTCAELVLVEASVCARKPQKISHESCASVPLVAITAAKAFRAAGLKQGGRVLITGGAGGVGSIAIQLAKAMFGASFVATTASAGAKTRLCEKLGADLVVDYRTAKFEEVLQTKQAKQANKTNEGEGAEEERKLFDCILDCTGEAAKCVRLLRPGGGSGLVSILAGPTSEALRTWMTEAKVDPATITVGVRPFLFSRAGGAIFEAVSGARRLRNACAGGGRGATFSHVIGTGNGEIMAKVAALLEDGTIAGVVDRVFDMAEAVEAIEYQKAGHAAGKVVIRVRGAGGAAAAADDDDDQHAGGEGKEEAKEGGARA